MKSFINIVVSSSLSWVRIRSKCLSVTGHCCTKINTQNHKILINLFNRLFFIWTKLFSQRQIKQHKQSIHIHYKTFNNFIKSHPNHSYLLQNVIFNSFYLAFMLWPCVCLCLLQVRVLQKWINGCSWFLVQRLSPACPILCCKEIQVSPKIRAPPPGTLSQTLD